MTAAAADAAATAMTTSTIMTVSLLLLLMVCYIAMQGTCARFDSIDGGFGCWSCYHCAFLPAACKFIYSVT